MNPKDYSNDYPYKVQYKRRDGFRFNSIFKSKGEAQEYIFETCKSLKFERYVCVKAAEDGYIWSENIDGESIEMKLIDNVRDDFGGVV